MKISKITLSLSFYLLFVFIIINNIVNVNIYAKNYDQKNTTCFNNDKKNNKSDSNNTKPYNISGSALITKNPCNSSINGNKEKKDAINKAIKHWSIKVTSIFGEEYSDWDNAISKTETFSFHNSIPNECTIRCTVKAEPRLSHGKIQLFGDKNKKKYPIYFSNRSSQLKSSYDFPCNIENNKKWKIFNSNMINDNNGTSSHQFFTNKLISKNTSDSETLKGINTNLHGDDRATNNLPIGFSFNYWGKEYTLFGVSINGWIRFPEASSTYSNTDFPNPNSLNGLIAAFFDDIRTDAPDQPEGIIFYLTTGSEEKRKLVIQYNDMYFFGSNLPMGTFEIILFEKTNEIKFQYRYLRDEGAERSLGNSATIGIDDPDTDNYVRYSFNEASLNEKKAILFTPDGEGGYIMNANAPFEWIDISGLTVLQPYDSGEYTNSDVITFSWNETNAANAYRIDISTSQSESDIFTSVILKKKDVLSYNFSQLHEDTVYYARVAASLNNGNTFQNPSPFSDGITVDYTAPLSKKPYITPLDDGTVKFLFNADEKHKIEKYHIQISDDASFSNPLIYTAISQNEYIYNGDIDNVLYAKSYAEDGAGNVGEFGPISDPFTLSDRPSAVIDLISPTGAVFDDLVTFEGHGISINNHPIVAYHWSMIRLIQDNEEIGSPVELGLTQKFLSDNLPLGKWRVYFRVKDDTNSWSPPHTIDIEILKKEEVTDLVVSRNDIRFFNEFNQEEFNPIKGDIIQIEANIHNLSTLDTPDEIAILFYEGKAEADNLLGVQKISQIRSGQYETIRFKWKVGYRNDLPIDGYQNGYKVITVRAEYTENLDNSLKIHHELTYQNNFGTAFIVVGPSDPGAFRMDIETYIPPLLYAGQYFNFSGSAHYYWGVKLPVMGAQVRLEFENGDQYSTRSRAPYGNFAMGIALPNQEGEYKATVWVFDNNLYGKKDVIFHIEKNHVYIYPYEPPPLDIYIHRKWDCLKSYADINFLGESVYYPENNSVRSIVHEELTINALIGNSGAFPINESFDVAFYVGNPENGGILLGSSTINGLSACTKTLVTCPMKWLPNEAKIYNIFVRVDTNNVIKEANEYNNIDSAAIKVCERKIDLCAYELLLRCPSYRKASIYFSQEKPVKNDIITIFADIYNRGHKDLDNSSFNVSFFSGNLYDTHATPVKIGTVNVTDSISSGDFKTISLNWDTSSFSPGRHEIFIIIDEENQVSEEDEANNESSTDINLYPLIADLWPIDINFSNGSPVPNSEVELVGTVLNAGGIDAYSENVIMSIEVNDEYNLVTEIGNKQSGIVKGRGGTKSIPFSWKTPSLPGTIFLFLEVNGRHYRKTLIVSKIPSPDLKIYSEDIGYSPSSPMNSNEEIKVWATIENVSPFTDATNFMVHFFTNSPLKGLVELGSSKCINILEKNSQMRIDANTTFKAIEPYYNIMIQLKPSFEQNDANYLNNEATTSLYVDTGKPFAIAGDDIFADVGDLIKLDGSNSLNASMYVWEFISKPASSMFTLVNSDSASPEFYAYTAGIYKIRLKVSNGIEFSKYDEIIVTAGQVENVPYADAGDNQDVKVSDIVELNGSRSLYASGYLWNFVQKPQNSIASLQGEKTVNPRFVPDIEGEYIVELKVRNKNYYSKPNNVSISAQKINKKNNDNDDGGTCFIKTIW